jgi:tetratricopeptide (TPR) repeat protein
MFELIIIISLAIIFFIFLVRMPEVERIGEKSKGTTIPLFKKGFKRIVNFVKKIRLPRFKKSKLIRFGDLEGAEKLYLRLAVISPNDATIYASLGRIYLERLNYKDAVASFKAAINRDRKNGFYYYDLATALFKDGRYEEAILCFEKSILINNRIPIRHLGLGLTLMKIGENGRAAESFRKAIVIEPNNEKYKRLLKKAQAKSYSSALN